MNIIICGAGEVGLHAAEVLEARAHNVTVIDKSPSRIRKIEDTLDVRTLRGNCAAAEILTEAGCKSADLVVAATSSDEINLLTAAVAKAVGAKKTVVRVHHSTYFTQRGLDYQKHLGIDQLICPEYSTAQAIAQTIRNPGAHAIENFARGQVEMHEIPVSEKAAAAGLALSNLGLPRGSRLAAIGREDRMFIPDGASVIQPGDRVVLVGNASVFQQARKLFHDDKVRRRKVAIMGGSYGGYATLVGLTFTPEVFACGVDIVGPSNLETLIASVPPYWEPVIAQFHERVGNPNTPEGLALLKERSPLYKADEITRPLLIGQGANDPRVKRAESDQIVNAMKEAGIPVTYVLFPDEGHGFAKPANNIAFNAVAENFLANCLGGRAEPIGDTVNASTARLVEGAQHVAGLTETQAD